MKSFNLTKRNMRGFTLIELAFSILIITLLLGGLLVPLNTQLEQRKINETQKLLEQAREALVGYAIANGRLPCPALNGSSGLEVFDTANGGNASNGLCANNGPVLVGFLPAATLGLTPVDENGFAVDAWGGPQQRIRYAVSNPYVAGNPTYWFTKSNGMREATMATISAETLLYVCKSATGATATGCSATNQLTNNAAAIVYSVGANAATGGINADEAQNPNPQGGSEDVVFVSHVKTDRSAPGGEFDDIVIWLSPYTLFTRMVQAGQLP